MATKTRTEKASDKYKKGRAKVKTSTTGNKKTKAKIKEEDQPKKTGMRSYKSKYVLG